MPKTHRVLIVDDHLLLRDGIKQALLEDGSYEVIGELSDGLDVYGACHRLLPDLVIIDLGLPGMNGIDVIRQVKQRWPALPMLVLTASATEHSAQEALRAGANGYALKASSKDTLLKASSTVIRGIRFVDPCLKQDIIEGLSRADVPGFSLTMRERQVLQLVAEGATNRDVASRLNISVKTVETHRLNLMRKLDAHKAVDLANWAHRLGLAVSVATLPR